MATSADATINNKCPTVNITMAGVTAAAYTTWSTAEATKAFATNTDQYTMKVAAVLPATLSSAIATPAATTGGMWAYGNKLTATAGDFAMYGVKYDKNATANDTQTHTAGMAAGYGKAKLAAAATAAGLGALETWHELASSTLCAASTACFTTDKAVGYTHNQPKEDASKTAELDSTTNGDRWNANDELGFVGSATTATAEKLCASGVKVRMGGATLAMAGSLTLAAALAI